MRASTQLIKRRLKPTAMAALATLALALALVPGSLRAAVIKVTSGSILTI
jgi:hypothetical protein